MFGGEKNTKKDTEKGKNALEAEVMFPGCVSTFPKCVKEC